MYTESPRQMDQRSVAFTYHAPKENQPERYQRIRDAGNALSLLLNTNCPESRELSIAQTKLEEVIMFANASIARNEK